MHIDDFDYELPEKLIAQYPNKKRDISRLLVLDRRTGQVEHKLFHEILSYFNPGDCLVLNNSKVIPARLFGIKENTGAGIELLLLKRKDGDVWEVMAKPAKKLKPGDNLIFGDGKLRAQVVAYTSEGMRKVKFFYDPKVDFMTVLNEVGKIPLPPYIHRESNDLDKERYQTVYCKEEGSVAAPTAGLHFTEELLEAIKDKGVRIAYVTLHVGVGTFKPVKCDIIEEHKMHFEEYRIEAKDAELINKAKAECRRIISVGTTSARTLESAAIPNLSVNARIINQYVIHPGSGKTGIFIYPGYKFKIVDSLITNFHLPKSTLLMLISAMYNKEFLLRLYRVAIEREYRFFSYGDAMFII